MTCTQCKHCGETLRTTGECNSGVCEDCQISRMTERSLWYQKTNWFAKTSLPQGNKTEKRA